MTAAPSRALDLQLLVDRGYLICGECGGLVRPARELCPFCDSEMNPESRDVAKVQSPRRGKPMFRRGDMGSLADIPDRRVTFTVRGLPVSEGSITPVAAGVVKHAAGKKLKVWRDAVTAAARHACGTDWRPVNCAVMVGLVFTVPRPESAPGRPVPADGYRDLDKLQRAVGDALCPRDPKQFRVLASDMRIVGFDVPYKTHPRPWHFHPQALDVPGVVITVRDGTEPLRATRIDGVPYLLTPLPQPTTEDHP